MPRIRNISPIRPTLKAVLELRNLGRTEAPGECSKNCKNGVLVKVASRNPSVGYGIRVAVEEGVSAGSGGCSDSKVAVGKSVNVAVKSASGVTGIAVGGTGVQVASWAEVAVAASVGVGELEPWAVNAGVSVSPGGVKVGVAVTV